MEWIGATITGGMGIVGAYLAYVWGRRSRREQQVENLNEYHHKRATENAELHDAADLMSKFSDLQAKLGERQQNPDDLARLIDATKKISDSRKGVGNDKIEEAKLIAHLIDDIAQVEYDFCVLAERYMELADELGLHADKYFLALNDLMRLNLLHSLSILHLAKHWGYPRDPTGVIAQYTEFLRSQVSKKNLGRLAIEFAEEVSWTKGDMQEFVSGTLKALKMNFEEANGMNPHD